MNQLRPFLVGAGPLKEQRMHAASLALSRFWGGSPISYSCGDRPNEILKNVSHDQGLVELHGDSAILMVEGCSWLEALGFWKQPTILMVEPLPSGQIPGIASAYVALCKCLSVPLIGVVQLGGEWESWYRRVDGLPWCGIISDDELSFFSANNYSEDQLVEFSSYKIVELLKCKMRDL